MFDWSTFWHYHRRKWWIERRPGFFGGLKQLPLDLIRIWPKRSLSSGPIGEVVYWAKIFIGVFLCWVVTDWLVPANPLVSIALAFVLWRLLIVFIGKLRGL
jgi:hypothetical protein